MASSLQSLGVGDGDDSEMFGTTAAAGATGPDALADDDLNPDLLRDSSSVGFGQLRFPSYPSVPRSQLHASNANSSPAPASLSLSTLRGTPEDRQRAVAKMLARNNSFSEKIDEERELTPDGGRDPSPSSTPASGPLTAPVGLSAISFDNSLFVKEAVTPARSYTSALSDGIHRPSVDGPNILTPNRYCPDTPPQKEYSASGARKAARYKCSVFLPTPGTDCLHMQIKRSTTASELIILVLSEYLRTHAQPAPTMLGQPGSYRLCMAEEDGELDDSFPPLDPTCVISGTNADCFLLQRQPPRTSGAVNPAAVRPRMAGMSISSDERSVSRSGGSLSRRSDEDNRSYSPSPDAGRRSPRPGVRSSHRTSSDLDDQLAAFEDGRARGSSMQSTSPHEAAAGSGQRKRIAPFTWRNFLTCACFAKAEEQETMDPAATYARRSSQ